MKKKKQFLCEEGALRDTLNADNQPLTESQQLHQTSILNALGEGIQVTCK